MVGKGGAGKSVIAGTMARILARGGQRVLALDSDLLPGLSVSLGSGPDPVEPPLLAAATKDGDGRWSWRTGIGPETAAQRFATDAPDGVRLLQRGKLPPEGFHAIVGSSKAFYEVVHGLREAEAFRDWALIGDLSGGPREPADDWAPYARLYVIVVQPSTQSALTARRLARLVRMRDGTRLAFVANRVQGERDVRHIEGLIGEPVLASVPADDDVATAERLGIAPIDHVPEASAVAAIERLVEAMARVYPLAE